MRDYFDKEGREITVFEFRELFNKEGYREVKRDLIDGYLISTQWLGINMNYSGDGKPIIFETMIFIEKEMSQAFSYQERYSTKEQAIKGHEIAVLFVKSKIQEKRVKQNGSGRGRSISKQNSRD